LWTISFPQGEARRLTNDLADYSSLIDATPYAKVLAAVQITNISQLCVATAEDLSKVQQITSGEVSMTDVVTGRDGKLVGISYGRLWTMNADGSRRVELSVLNDAGWLTACNPFMVFVASHGGVADLMRIDADGSNAKRLASGAMWSPACSPDGKFVFYADIAQPGWRIRRVSIDGGDPVDVAENLGESMPGNVSISPDGTLLSYPFDVYTPEPALKVAVVPIAGGPPLKVINVPAGMDGPRWSPDGRGLQYLLTRGGATNLWEQPLAGGEAKQLTKFTSGLIVGFSWSSDHSKLLLTGVSVSSDVVLLSNLH